MEAGVTRIPKPYKNNNLETSYRPISLLSTLAKIPEKTVLPCITNNISRITTQHLNRSTKSIDTLVS